MYPSHPPTHILTHFVTCWLNNAWPCVTICLLKLSPLTPTPPSPLITAHHHPSPPIETPQWHAPHAPPLPLLERMLPKPSHLHQSLVSRQSWVLSLKLNARNPN